MFWIALSILPFIVRLWRQARPRYASAVEMLKADSELRMSIGYMLTVIAVGCFASVGWFRSLMIEAGQFGDLSLFQRWARWWLMAPLTTMICLGAGMILWDFAAKWGKMACLALLAVASALYALGSVADDYVIRWLWG